MTKCESCGGALLDRMATVEAPYAYTLSGLKDVFLAGIAVRGCPACGVQLPSIPRIEELHRLIARELVRKPTPLRGDEIKFLRKHAGFPAVKFAALLGVDPAHLSRIENGHRESLGEATDKLARAIAVIAKDGDTARDVLLQMADAFEKGGSRKPPAKAQRRPLFRLERKRWALAA